MIYVLLVLGYVVLGFLCIWAAAFIHLLTAEKRGYRACAYWEENIFPVIKNEKYRTLKVIFGLIIWPVRFIQFLLSIKRLYEEYHEYTWRWIVEMEERGEL